MQKNKSKSSQIILIILSIAGIAIMGYLVSLHYSGDSDSFCNLGEGLSCDIVNKSLYAKAFGIPFSIFGILYFIGIFLVSIFKFNEAWLKASAFFSIVFLGPSLYLSGIEFFVLENICIFCELSKILMLAIITVAIIALKPEKLKLKTIGVAVLISILSGFLIYVNHSRQVEPGK